MSRDGEIERVLKPSVREMILCFEEMHVKSEDAKELRRLIEMEDAWLSAKREKSDAAAYFQFEHEERQHALYLLEQEL
jgi:hypothetical protein